MNFLPVGATWTGTCQACRPVLEDRSDRHECAAAKSAALPSTRQPWVVGTELRNEAMNINLRLVCFGCNASSHLRCARAHRKDHHTGAEVVTMLHSQHVCFHSSQIRHPEYLLISYEQAWLFMLSRHLREARFTARACNLKKACLTDFKSENSWQGLASCSYEGNLQNFHSSWGSSVHGHGCLMQKM